MKLMLKWPNLYYSTSAFAPKHYPQEIINYANTRGADKIIYAGYFPFGLTLERIFSDMPHVPFKDEGRVSGPAGGAADRSFLNVSAPAVPASAASAVAASSGDRIWVSSSMIRRCTGCS